MFKPKLKPLTVVKFKTNRWEKDRKTIKQNPELMSGKTGVVMKTFPMFNVEMYQVLPSEGSITGNPQIDWWPFFETELEIIGPKRKRLN